MEVDGCLVPEDRLYDVENDVWLKPTPDGDSATLGITGTLASFAGKFQSVTFRPQDAPRERGQSVATIESVRYTGAVRLPVAGRVVEQNPDIVRRPKLLNDAPFDLGWVVRISLTAPVAPVAPLESAAAIRDRLAEKVRALRIRCFPASPDVEVYEIGAECAAVLARLDEEIARRAPGEVVLLVTDDATSPIEMVRWSDRSGHPLLAHRVEGNLHHFLVRREAHPTPRRR